MEETREYVKNVFNSCPISLLVFFFYFAPISCFSHINELLVLVFIYVKLNTLLFHLLYTLTLNVQFKG